MNPLYIYIFLSLWLLPWIHSPAQPQLDQRLLIEDQVLYPDAQDSLLYYYSPGKLSLLHDTQGEPDFRFVQMRYTGTQATANQGLRRFNSLLKLGLGLTDWNHEIMRRTLKQLGPDVSLKPLPIHRMEAELIYALPDGNQRDTLRGGFFENVTARNQAIWQQKTLTLRLDPHSAQAFWDAFRQGRSLLSVSYSCYARGISEEMGEVQGAGNGELVKDMQEHLTSAIDSLQGPQSVTRRVISNAFSVYIDPQRFPELMKQVDINEGMPPDYPALDVYCFDFNNDIRKDLFAKELQLRAAGVGRGEVKTQLSFRATEADIYAHAVRFPYAVRMDRPYFYRVVEISKEGEVQMGPWQKRTSWTSMLDITTQMD